MITCEHTSNTNNINQQQFNNNNENDLNGDLLTINDNLITNNSLHNNEINDARQINKQFTHHNHNSEINSNLKSKPPSSLFIYPNLIYVCEVYRGNRLVRNITTTLSKQRANNSNNTLIHGMFFFLNLLNNNKF